MASGETGNCVASAGKKRNSVNKIGGRADSQWSMSWDHMLTHQPELIPLRLVWQMSAEKSDLETMYRFTAYKLRWCEVWIAAFACRACYFIVGGRCLCTRSWHVV